MAEQLTAQQREAVTNRGGKLLVSAAAGSGKTKVLVDRLLSYLTDPTDPANMDEFLIITYTKAAAAELRSKIAAKITERIAENPENQHLQRQMQRLYLAQISTVHSFCTDILREHAHRLDISGDFRVADENECVELQVKAMDRVLERGYADIANNSDLQAFIDSQGLGRDDRQIPQIVLAVHERAQCHLDPEKWLEDCLTAADTTGIADAAKTVWGQYLMSDLHNYLNLQIGALEKCAEAAMGAGMTSPAALLWDTVDQLRILYNCQTWDAILQNKDIQYGKLTFSKKTSDPILEQKIKAVRNACKNGLAKKLKRFSGSSTQVLEGMQDSVAATRGLVALVRSFMREYDALKRSRRILDFADLEHKTLDIILGRKRTGPTGVALEVGARYREIMIDEYQDSNAVQDAIFFALTCKTQACFMVGDVKQSIYQFRMADPGIFLEKYNTYASVKSASPGQGRKVLLSSNFRSGSGVISAVNDVFGYCMSENVGGLIYGDDEQLLEGIPHVPLNEPEVELYGLQVQSDTYAEEAAFTAERICQLLDGKHMIRKGNELRPITAGDIVILLRSPGSVGADFCYALERCGIRCITGKSTDLLRTEEIEVLRSIMQIISNPLQDIPLIAVMTSRVFGFCAEDMAMLRVRDRFSPLYQILRKSEDPRIIDFLHRIEMLRMESRMCTLSQLIDRIFSSTQMDCLFGAMQDGDMRVENLQSFCRIVSQFENTDRGDLLRFLDYLTAMEKRGLSTPEEATSGDAVTVMSIHKSKGLEFPVVFLCGMSKGFNLEDSRGQVLCDSDLGLGLCSVDAENRIWYPTIAKRAIAAKIQAESISEEVRVLYVAMTRARDRLIMTYASPYLEKELSNIVDRMDFCDPLLMTGDVGSSGEWVLQSALRRQEADEFFAVTGRPDSINLSPNPWKIRIVNSIEQKSDLATHAAHLQPTLPQEIVAHMRETLTFRYPHSAATKTPSKQTATQLKGRYKDQEAAEMSANTDQVHLRWRGPAFADATTQGKTYGSALHAVMQYIRFEACGDLGSVEAEIQRLADDGFISESQKSLVESTAICDFFQTDIGLKLRQSNNVLREFKFSILDDGARYDPDVQGEEILLQGVVDCALVEEDGITIIDFKTDRVTEDTVLLAVERYRMQVQTYAYALERIYQTKVKKSLLYFFQIKKFIAI